MGWTDQHDVLMLREMIVSDVFSFKERKRQPKECVEFESDLDSPQR